jgi:hypothetical protein
MSSKAAFTFPSISTLMTVARTSWAEYDSRTPNRFVTSYSSGGGVLILVGVGIATPWAMIICWLLWQGLRFVFRSRQRQIEKILAENATANSPGQIHLSVLYTNCYDLSRFFQDSGMKCSGARLNINHNFLGLLRSLGNRVTLAIGI